jgi:hypothetical protein
MSTTVTRPDESEVTAPAKSGRTSAGIRRALPAAAILIAIGLIWEAVSHWFGVPNYVLPHWTASGPPGVSGGRARWPARPG